MLVYSRLVAFILIHFRKQKEQFYYVASQNAPGYSRVKSCRNTIQYSPNLPKSRLYACSAIVNLYCDINKHNLFTFRMKGDGFYKCLLRPVSGDVLINHAISYCYCLILLSILLRSLVSHQLTATKQSKLHSVFAMNYYSLTVCILWMIPAIIFNLCCQSLLRVDCMLVQQS